jgi:hypothetical protein
MTTIFIFTQRGKEAKAQRIANPVCFYAGRKEMGLIIISIWYNFSLPKLSVTLLFNYAQILDNNLKSIKARVAVYQIDLLTPALRHSNHKCRAHPRREELMMNKYKPLWQQYDKVKALIQAL